MKRVIILGLCLILVLGLAVGCSQKPTASVEPEKKSDKEEAKAEVDWPTKDIKIIVPWNPGGGTDLTTRTIADEMSKALDATIMVVNTPGASGSIGTQEVLNSPHDGYTIAANGMMPFVSYSVMGYLKNTYRDWHVWLATFSPNVIAVNKDSQYKDMKTLVDAFKNGEVSVGTAGPGTGGHIGIEVVRSSLDFDYNHVPYGGGNPAIVAALSGEVDVTPQLSMEMIDMLRSGDLKGLAALTEGPLQISEEIAIPSLADVIPEAAKAVPMGESFGIAVPKDTPKEVVDKIDEAFKKAIESEAVKKFAEEKGVVVLGYSGDKAQKFLDKLASVVCWTLYDAGNAKISPEKFDIPRAE
ncbi:tripartite tricarboxylate transporter substrate binding protein [Paramaledivibacter caminithermalis]|jgi:tripartite-type tricarboxylate transporter receptor subunit TctC|uniref:Tripartite-type tricarboxylate transporter, receptor component TctC n=1 Tax=Paramaledivibacter caminithermalis (strain DSM 15212 / CIP 107654 / DViRD3) TaxID=1121301 RepID=A0A1M6NSU9_PARC5|nr:tripartite tricarboxylate transporter substrate binding protein [Paramaledivibacter caminithermalis]SHJ98779.1 Tripartite-type tricarboxylate transporter, receptor component TctC [Paramaledivibacter caminithermalis DSM 15212]